MKGPFSFWTFFGLTLWIDIITHIIYKFKKIPVSQNNIGKNQEVSVIIPAHKEEAYIKRTIRNLYLQKIRLKNVFVCGDKFSDKMQEKVALLQEKYPELYYVKCPNKSKAKKINYLVKIKYSVLADYVYVKDCRVNGKKNCIIKMLKRFDSENVSAVTSYGYLNAPKNFLSRSYFYGKSWINEIGRFRKNAQDKRKAVFVICGASTIYRKNILKEIPLPYQSKTEDTYHTWIMQMRGYIVRVADNAVVHAPDVDGSRLKGLKSQIKQSYRWSSGTLQCLYSEGFKIAKNKRLFYSTILPGFLESLMYAGVLLLLPFLAFFFPWFALGFLIGDTVFSLIGTLILMPKKIFRTILHYPQILFFKYLNAGIFFAALAAVSTQALLKKKYKWTNEWEPPETRKLFKADKPEAAVKQILN